LPDNKLPPKHSDSPPEPLLPSDPPPNNSSAPDGANKLKPLDDFYGSKLEHKLPEDAAESKPPSDDLVEPKPLTSPPDDYFSFESEPPTFSLQRLIQLSPSPADQATETIYSAITKIFNDALILSPYLVHSPHPNLSQSLNGPM